MIGTILSGCIAVLSAFITVVEIVLAVLGMQYARISVANDYMAFGKIITQALAAIFVVLAPVVAVMAGVVFVLSLISCLLRASSLKKHRNLPYSMTDLKNTTG
ncbi:hypothetical protein [Pseudoramibacter alactolyticus]|uniref:hypothetical protein n=1 Tax=Pseudoramibacter alactolyticus TaxID=113287 RepID=UPI0028E74C52|nr:hypothetical protein [Pseudoramibacter alactolyticus]